MAQAQRCALGFRAAMRSDQCPQPRAVDILDVVHIQDDLLLSCGDQALQFLTQSIALLAEHDATVKREKQSQKPTRKARVWGHPNSYQNLSSGPPGPGGYMRGHYSFSYFPLLLGDFTRFA